MRRWEGTWLGSMLVCFPLSGFSGGESSLDMSLSECKESGSIIRIEREKIVFVVHFCKQTLHLVLFSCKKFWKISLCFVLKSVHTLHTCTSKVPDNRGYCVNLSSSLQSLKALWVLGSNSFSSHTFYNWTCCYTYTYIHVPWSYSPILRLEWDVPFLSLNMLCVGRRGRLGGLLLFFIFSIFYTKKSFCQFVI